MLLDISILPQTGGELFYFVTKRIPYLCGFWRFANAYKSQKEKEREQINEKNTTGARAESAGKIMVLVIKLNRYRHEYYNLAAPSVSDALYDRLFDERL